MEQELEKTLDRLQVGLDAETYDKVLELISSEDPIPPVGDGPSP